MLTGDILIQQYTTTHDVIMRLTAAISHDESLLEWSFEANTLNWLMGHVTVARLNLLAMLGDRETIWDFAQARHYIPGSDPVTKTSTSATPFEDIRAAFERTQPRLIAALQAQTAETLAAVVPDSTRTLGAELLYYAQHEAFHAGQMELHRMMAGKPPVIGFE